MILGLRIIEKQIKPKVKTIIITKNIVLWGPELVTGSFAHSLIFTTGTSLTSSNFAASRDDLKVE